MRLALRRSVCVFCGSRPGGDPAYAAAATELGAALAGAGLRLVYGAGDVGLMGAVAAAAIAAGGETLGVVPAHLVAREAARTVPGRDLARVVVTETMHERKKVMFMNADAIVTLPGGPGSLDELFEVLTWRQLGLHAKPVYLLNVQATGTRSSRSSITSWPRASPTPASSATSSPAPAFPNSWPASSPGATAIQSPVDSLY